jgi:pimeloyl-ACP methyl ester carboxylesterase
VLWGRHDPYLRVEHAERQREAFPRAEVRVLDRAGHWAFADQPKEVAAAVTAFLARVAQAEASPAPLVASR